MTVAEQRNRKLGAAPLAPGTRRIINAAFDPKAKVT